ncbi:MAG: hypothetical protein RMM58_00085 [Chloroflexota bacterium]|nr:hypothetical protein [Dehalococcoidia bacterium]MDW8252260.1 hypothetical protein [Chloroflexota bacterium]
MTGAAEAPPQLRRRSRSRGSEASHAKLRAEALHRRLVRAPQSGAVGKCAHSRNAKAEGQRRKKVFRFSRGRRAGWCILAGRAARGERTLPPFDAGGQREALAAGVLLNLRSEAQRPAVLARALPARGAWACGDVPRRPEDPVPSGQGRVGMRLTPLLALGVGQGRRRRKRDGAGSGTAPLSCRKKPICGLLRSAVPYGFMPVITMQSHGPPG